MSIPSVVSAGGTPTVNAGVAEITDTMKAVSKDYLSLLSTTTTRQGNTDLDAVRMSFNADSFTSNSIGGNGDNEEYIKTATEKYYKAVDEGLTTIEDFESYADTTALIDIWIKTHATASKPTLDGAIFKTGSKCLKMENSIGATNNGVYKVFGTPQDYSGNTVMKFWARTSILTAGWEIEFYDDNDGVWRGLKRLDWQHEYAELVDTWYEYTVDFSLFPSEWVNNITQMKIKLWTGAFDNEYAWFDDFRVYHIVNGNMVLCGNTNIPTNRQNADAVYLSFHAEHRSYSEEWDSFDTYADTTALKAVWVPSNDTNWAVTQLNDFNHGTYLPDAGKQMRCSFTTNSTGETITKTLGATEDWSDVKSIKFRMYQNSANCDFTLQIYDNTTAQWYIIKTEDFTETESNSNHWDYEHSLSHIPISNRTTISKVQFVAIGNTGGAEIRISAMRLFRRGTPYTLNTDLKAFVTVDGGTNWNELTLINEGVLEGNYDRITGSSEDITPTGTNVKYKIQTYNNTGIYIHDVSIWWPKSVVVEILPQLSPNIFLNKGMEYGQSSYYEFFDPMIYGHNSLYNIFAFNQDFDLNNREFVKRYSPYISGSTCLINNTDDYTALYRRFPCIQLKMVTSGNIYLHPQWAVAPDEGWDNIYMEFDILREDSNDHNIIIGFGHNGTSIPRCCMYKDGNAVTGHIYCNNAASPEVSNIIISSSANTWETWKILLRMDSIGVTSVEFWIDETMQASYANEVNYKGMFALYPILIFNYNGGNTDIFLKNLHIKAIPL